MLLSMKERRKETSDSWLRVGSLFFCQSLGDLSPFSSWPEGISHSVQLQL